MDFESQERELGWVCGIGTEQYLGGVRKRRDLLGRVCEKSKDRP